MTNKQITIIHITASADRLRQLILITILFCSLGVQRHASCQDMDTHKSTLDPALLANLSKEPSIKPQDLIIYPGNSTSDSILCHALSSSGALAMSKGRPARRVHPPAADTIFGMCYGQQSMWAVCGTDATSTVELLRFDLKTGSGQWEMVGPVDITGGVPSLLTPLKNGRSFIGIGTRSFYETPSMRSSFVGIFRQREGRIQLETCIDLPFEELGTIVKGQWYAIPSPEYQDASANQAGKGPSRSWMAYADPAILTPTLYLPSVSDDFLVLGASAAGALWIFDLEDGRLRHTLNLSGLKAKQLDKLSPIKQVILGTAFAPDGSLIVASVDPILIKMVTSLDLDERDSQQRGWMKGDVDNLVREIKEIRWRRIDPATGFEEHISSPISFPEKVPSVARHEVFRFFVDREGNVRTNAFTPWARVLESLIQQHEKSVEVKNPVPGARMPEAPCPLLDPQDQGSGSIRRMEPAQDPVKE